MVDTATGNEKLERTSWFAVFLFVITITIALAIFAGGGNIQEYIEKSTWYFAFGLYALVIGTALTIIDLIMRRKNKDARTASYIWNPEQSYFPEGKRPSLLLIILISVFAFTSISVLFAINNTFFLSIPPVTQQISEASKLVLGAEPAASSETASFMVGVLPLAVMLIGLIPSLKKRNRAYWRGWSLVIAPIVLGLFGYAMHLGVYGFNETALLFTFTFWSISALITMLTGTFIPAYIWHVLNNFFVSANSQFSSDIYIFWTVLGIAIPWTILLVIYLKRRKKRKR